MLYKALVAILLLFPGYLFAFQSIVILPFSNDSEKQEIYWLGEGFAESLSEEMLLNDAYVIQRPERKTAYDDLRLPYVGHLSRATMLKIGEKLAADYVIFGSYNLKGSELQVKAQVIRLSSSELSPPILVSGLLEGLYQVQTELKEGLINFFASKKVMSAPTEAKNIRSVPLHAYELYIKGLLETSDVERVQFFQRAIDANPDYVLALYRLSVTLSKIQRYKESNDALAKLSGTPDLQPRAEFLEGLNSYFLRDFNAAHGKWQELARANPSAEVMNNIGIAFLRKNDLENALSYLNKAVELDPDESDYHFNLAACYVLRKQEDYSIHHYKETIQLIPNDYQAFYLLGKLLEKDATATSRKVMSLFLENLPSDQKGKFPEQFTSSLHLLRPAMSFLSAEEKKYMVMARDRYIRQRDEYVKTYQSSAKRRLDRKESSQAILEIKKGITWAPFDWYLNYLWGMTYQQDQNYAAAVPQLEFSIWCLDNIDSRLALAEIYRQWERYSDSKAQIQQILVLDPKNKKALDIWAKIWDKLQ